MGGDAGGGVGGGVGVAAVGGMQTCSPLQASCTWKGGEAGRCVKGVGGGNTNAQECSQAIYAGFYEVLNPTHT